MRWTPATQALELVAQGQPVCAWIERNFLRLPCR